MSRDEKRGQELWHMFVVLDEQMRRQQDVDYYQLLKRARSAAVIQSDMDLLQHQSRDTIGFTRHLHSTDE